MKRKFNITGLCLKNLHYSADTSQQLNEIFERLIEYGEYFTINRGRQFGKTTTMHLLKELFKTKDDYLLIKISFEGIGNEMFKNEDIFSKEFLMTLYFHLNGIDDDLANEFKEAADTVSNMKDLSTYITSFAKEKKKKVVLMIDEVDKSSNNQVFLSFLAMLRDKYLIRHEKETFHSVILAGVHDTKTLKIKIREGEEEKLNSPWNIAADFDIDLSFRPHQIVTLLDDYLSEHPNIKIPKQEIAEKIYYYTHGYPFLVSLMCKTIEEKIIPKRDDKNWKFDDAETAFKMITYPGYTTTLFDSMSKNILDNKKLYQFIYSIVIDNAHKIFVLNNPTILLANTYGIIKDDNGCKIHNRIFEQRLYDLLLSLMQENKQFIALPTNNEYYKGKDIDLEYTLLRFQRFYKENYSTKDLKFIEREGRLIFLSYLQPIINSKGFIFKEPVTGEERKLDIALTYNDKRYVIELKIWRGEKYLKKGLDQLSDYMDKYSLKKGYLLIFDFSKNKKYKHETIQFEDKEIFTVYV